MLGVNLQDYATGPLHQGALFDSSQVTPESLQQLAKALEAGSFTGGSTAGSTVAGAGAPLKVESLDKTLKHLEYRESDIVFWKTITKSPAYNTVEEFNQLVSYGADRGGFNNEGELPEEEDSTYRRVAEKVKFLGVTKSVSHPMQLVRVQPGIGDIVQREINNGTMWILRKANRSLSFGDESIVPQEYNGFYAQQRNSYSTLIEYFDSLSVVDLRGRSLTEDDLETGAENIIENHGYPDVFIAPPVVLSDFAKEFYAFKHIAPNSSQVAAGIMGQKVAAVETTFGQIQLKYDKFMQTSKPRTLTSSPQSTKAPVAVTNVSGATVADGLSNYDADTAGDYFFAVAPVNRYGEGPLTLVGNAAINVNAGDAVDFTFTDGGGTYPATGYVVYASQKNSTGTASQVKFYPLFAVSTSDRVSGYDGAASGSVRDRNRFLPNTNQAWMFENTDQVLEFKQLAPLMKMDLAILSPSTRFMVLMYGTPQLFAPNKTVRYINIGRRSS